jgi:uncharacterized membrane protein
MCCRARAVCLVLSFTWTNAVVMAKGPYGSGLSFVPRNALVAFVVLILQVLLLLALLLVGGDDPPTVLAEVQP